MAIAITNSFSKKVENHALSVALHYMDYNFCRIHKTLRVSSAPARAVLRAVDEFQTFSSESFASLLSEARKFATHFCLANQYTDQLSHAVRAAVIGNAGTLVVFRVGSRDAELLAPEFRPMDPAGLADQEPFTAWLRLGVGRDRITAEDSFTSRSAGPNSSASKACSGLPGRGR